MNARASEKASATVRLTMAQALVRYVAALRVDGENAPLFGGVFAIFGHGNVAGIGEARRSTRIGTCCRRIARTTSRRWRTRPSPMRRRTCGGG